MTLAPVPELRRAPYPVERPPDPGRVAIVGLGYVGLPTALAFSAAGVPVTGIDIDERRLAAIRAHDVDVLDRDKQQVGPALAGDRLQLAADAAAIADADAVVICVPTPVDEHRLPDLRALRGACESVVAHCRPGQLLILTSTTYVGCTHDLLVEPLAARGLVAGQNVSVAFSPERIDPANDRFPPDQVPRVVGGVTASCAEAAREVVATVAPSVHMVSSAEAAEMTKLYENTFRAVNIALANELAAVSRRLDLDPVEVVDAAATKPYGFLPFYPGPGVGGHCIPCDPHYLLWQLRAHHQPAPIVERAMACIDARPDEVLRRAAEVLSEHGKPLRDARVLVVGVAYKPGVADVRESPALHILDRLHDRGARPAFTDAHVDEVTLPSGRTMHRCPEPSAEHDLVLVHTVHPAADHAWIDGQPVVLDATYRLDVAHRHIP
jgi:UDP-N-acetyl-D-glucosamine dehydrogenase